MFYVKLWLLGMSCIKCWKLFNVSVNTAVAIFRVITDFIYVNHWTLHTQSNSQSYSITVQHMYVNGFSSPLILAESVKILRHWWNTDGLPDLSAHKKKKIECS
jgi:hypothetical protein